MNYLDKTGVAYLWDKIKSYIQNRITPISGGGTGATTAAQARVNLGVDISQETIDMFADAGYPIE